MLGLLLHGWSLPFFFCVAGVLALLADCDLGGFRALDT